MFEDASTQPKSALELDTSSDCASRLSGSLEQQPERRNGVDTDFRMQKLQQLLLEPKNGQVKGHTNGLSLEEDDQEDESRDQVSYEDGEVVSLKSEDSRSLTLKRQKESDLKKSKKRKSSKKSPKSKKMKDRLLVEENPIVTRSRKKESLKPVTATGIGQNDDDSGIQGDIYEFSEKESNLEHVNVSSVMLRHHRSQEVNQFREDKKSEESVRRWNEEEYHNSDQMHTPEKQHR